MVAPNEQRVIKNQFHIWVTLVGGGTEAAISTGKPGSPSHPRHVSIKPFLAAGMSERDALKAVMEIAAIAVEGVTP